MKKQIIVSMLTVAAVFCSCSKQDDLSQTLGNDEQQVTFTLSATDVQTRAKTEVPLDRYVMEVYTDVACTVAANVFEDGTNHCVQDKAQFKLTLNSQNSYYCLFWADNQAEKVYDVASLQKVTLQADANPQEGFHAMLTVTKAQKDHSVTLTRAVAKVTLNETEKIKENSSLKTTYDRCNSFNVATATAGDAKNVEITTQITAPVDGTVDGPVWLAEFFTFASASGETVDFSFTLNSEPEKLVTNVPLKTNFVTNIKGEFSGLTSTKLDATASDVWKDMDIEVDATTLTTDELKTKLTTTTAKYWTINGTATSDGGSISTAVGDALEMVYNADNTKRISVTLPDVTTIEEYSFQSNDNLVAISLPKATTIESQVFQYFFALTSISMPEVISLGNSAFKNCVDLTSVSLPKVEIIGIEAFYDCGKLPTLSLPKATVIGEKAFAKTYALTTLTFGSVITSWGKDVFNYDTSLCDLTLKGGQRQPVGGDTWSPACTGELVEEGEGKTFAGTKFKSITLVD